MNVRSAYYSDYDDEMYVPPKRSSTPRRKKTLANKFVSRLKKNPKRFVGWTLLFGIASIITINALVLQTSRHPAPMFSASPAVANSASQSRAPSSAATNPPVPPVSTPSETPATVASTNTNAVPVPTNRTEAAPRDSIGDIIRTGSTNVAAPAVQASTAPVTPQRSVAPPQPPQRRDAIGDLIRQNSQSPVARSSTERAGNGASQSADTTDNDAQKRRIMAGQQALNKLGYGPLTADGVMGAGTQKAIQRFEFDRRLPVTGKFSGQTLSELSTMSKLAIR